MPVGYGRAPRPALPRGCHAGVRLRRVWFDEWIDTPTYWRPDLQPGDVVVGPAIVEEFGSTVPVHPGFRATVDSYANLLLTKDS